MLKLHILEADYGDSLILEYGSVEAPRFLLIDGGPDEVYENSLRYVLEGIRDAGWGLELAVLSHVDEDHVMGLLDLFTHLQWQRNREEPETIEIAELWHNTFSQSYGEDTNARFSKLMQSAGPVRGHMPVSDRVSRSIAQGDELSKLAGKLGIDINHRFRPDGLIRFDLVPDPIPLGNLSLQIIGPTEDNLTRLRKEWEEWLKKQEKRLLVDDPKAAERAAKYADTSKPNRSSIMFLAEADGKSILFTGDEEQFDEALCPYDCADGLIIDDELRELFGNVPDDVHLTVISDSCFSGTVTRVALGEVLPFLRTPDDRRMRFLSPVVHKRGEVLENPWRAKRNRKQKFPESKMKDVLLSGCSDNEYSYDAFIQGKYHGAMTFHAIQAIEEANYQLTYAQLGDRLTFLVDDAGYPQHPQVEGKLENKRRQIFT